MYKYLITSREFYTDTPRIFSAILERQLQKHSPTHVLFRDKSTLNYDALAQIFIEVCRKYEDIKTFLHQDIMLAKKIHAAGVHLTSMQFDKIKEAKRAGLEVIVSTHTHSEVLQAQNLGADAVTYSPIFFSPGKGKPKGMKDLTKLLERVEITVFALGGVVTQEHLQKLQKSKADGFASIRYFY